MSGHDNNGAAADAQPDDGVARRRFLRTAAATAIALPAVAAMSAGRASAGMSVANPPLSYTSALEPFRCYDSRWTTQSGGPILSFGRLTTGQTRSVAVWPMFDTTGTTAFFDRGVIPTSTAILAVTYNLTIVSTIGVGFLMVGPGGSTPTSSHINWFAASQVLANAGTVRIFPGAAGDVQTIQVRAGGPGSASTHFVVDITGWYEDTSAGPIIM
ncbi:MAG: hypothetical protein ABMA25_13590 [Ilumatobacteraceae bacterium]